MSLLPDDRWDLSAFRPCFHVWFSVVEEPPGRRLGPAIYLFLWPWSNHRSSLGFIFFSLWNEGIVLMILNSHSVLEFFFQCVLRHLPHQSTMIPELLWPWMQRGHKLVAPPRCHWVTCFLCLPGQLTSLRASKKPWWPHWFLGPELITIKRHPPAHRACLFLALNCWAGHFTHSVVLLIDLSIPLESPLLSELLHSKQFYNKPGPGFSIRWAGLDAALLWTCSRWVCYCHSSVYFCQGLRLFFLHSRTCIA